MHQHRLKSSVGNPSVTISANSLPKPLTQSQLRRHNWHVCVPVHVCVAHIPNSPNNNNKLTWKDLMVVGSGARAGPAHRPNTKATQTRNKNTAFTPSHGNYCFHSVSFAQRMPFHITTSRSIKSAVALQQKTFEKRKSY